MIHKTKFFAALALVGVVASIASAGQVAVIPTVVGRFDNATNFTPLSFTSPGAGPILDGPGLYQIDLSILTTNLGANERGFASLAFDVVPGANQTVGFDYAPDPSQVDNNGAAPGGLVAKWTTNTDAGTAGDYIGMLVAGPGSLAANPAIDPRGTLGDPDAEFFGSIFMNVTGAGTLGFTGYQYSLRDATTGQFLSPINGTIPSIVFGGVVVGVPPTVLDFTDSADLNETISTQITATGDNPKTWSGLQNPVYTPGFGALPGAPGAFFAPSWDPNTQQFSFNTKGASRGTYTWNVTATNATAPADQGLITINVPFVPEPSTMALLGLAAVGLVGCSRRR